MRTKIAKITSIMNDFKIILVRVVDISVLITSLFNKVYVILQPLCAYLNEGH